MVGSPLAAFTNSAERLIARKSYVDYCTILEVDKDGTDGVKCHSPDHPEYYNTVSLKIRSTKLVHEESQDPNAIQHVNALILQTFVGNCFGEPYIPRVGDLVAVLFMYNEKPLVLGPVATIQQPPVMRAPTSEDAKYDYVNKWCQWLRPEKDKNYDYFNHPQGKKPICFKRFHGPVTGSTGIGRDEMTVWDCQKGDADPTCTACSNIDSVPRSGEQWHKIYSTQTESEEAYNSRMELHARCGSYFRIESDNSSEHCSSSTEYSEGKGHIRIGNAVTESTKKGHLNYHPTGTIDIHSVHEEVPIASESEGTRVIVVSPEDSSVSYAVESKDFETGAFIRIMKDGTIHASSPSKITIDAPLIDEITELVHNYGNQQIDGTCTHGSCSCTSTFASLGSTSGGQTICGGTGVDEELTLCGTSDASKGCVNVDADLECTGNSQLPSICGSSQVDGELTLCGTTDASKGQVTVNSYLKCNGTMLVQGDDEFNSPGETASLCLGNTTISLKAVNGFGLKISTYNAADCVTIEESTGNMYVLGDVNCASVTDHTPAYEGNALTDLKYVTNDDQGKINHKTLPKFAQAIFKDPKTGQETEGRNIGNMVSILVKAIQELTEELDTVKLQLTKLESK